LLKELIGAAKVRGNDQTGKIYSQFSIIQSKILYASVLLSGIPFCLACPFLSACLQIKIKTAINKFKPESVSLFNSL
jgi:hypothetical protein